MGADERKKRVKPKYHTRTQILESGYMVGGKYQIISKLGSGGFGAVYKAIQKFNDKEVALKVLYSQPCTNKEDRIVQERQFKRECASLGKIDRHKNIVTILDSGLDRRIHALYLVMENIRGHTLSELYDPPIQIDPLDSMTMISAVLDALSFAHQHGIRHRDINPGNILIPFLLERENSVAYSLDYPESKLIDWGIAKPKDCGLDVTGVGEVWGTLEYMAPEYAAVILGEDHELTDSMDVYSSFLVLYECLIGRPVDWIRPESQNILLSEGQSIMKTVTKKIELQLVSPSIMNRTWLSQHGWNKNWDELILKGLTGPEARYETANEAKDALDEIIEGLKHKRKQKIESSKKRLGRLNQANLPYETNYDLEWIIDTVRESEEKELVFEFEKKYGTDFFLFTEDQWMRIIDPGCKNYFALEQYDLYLKLPKGRSKIVMIGRSEPKVNIKLRGENAQFISREHGYIKKEIGQKNEFYYVDNQSSGGTRINNRLVRPQQLILLKTGDEIGFSGKEGELRIFAKVCDLKKQIGLGMQTDCSLNVNYADSKKAEKPKRAVKGFSVPIEKKEDDVNEKTVPIPSKSILEKFKFWKKNKENQ